MYSGGKQNIALYTWGHKKRPALNGQRILTKSRIVSNVVTPTMQSGALHAAAAVALSRFLFSAAYMQSVSALTPNHFQWAGQPPYWPIPWVSRPHLNVVPWALPCLPSNRHVDRFSCFYMLGSRTRPTDTQTTLLRL